MRKTYKYRIYPTSKQAGLLSSQLEECRMLYNHFLSERKTLWENVGKSVSYYDQQNQLPTLKIQFPNLKSVYCQTLQNVAQRVDLAYKAFFRRVNAGEKEPGYPRFKGFGRYDSLTYPLYGRGIRIKAGRLNVTDLGHLKMVFHRPLEGTPKTAIIKRSSTGKWYVSFSCEIEKAKPLTKSELNIGIDVGLETFAYFSDENKIENPRFFKKEQDNLAKVQRKFDSVTVKDKNGKVLNWKDPKRISVKKVVSRVHERIKFKRDNFSHQESRKIINKYQIIAIEDLEINQMKSKDNGTFKTIRKSIADVSWNGFFQLLFCKAEEAGRTVIAVNPAYTSQDCSSCGNRKKKTLATRIHKCSQCGLTMNRDLNTSINILRIGLDSLGSSNVNP